MKVPFVDLKAQYLSIKSEIDEAISDVINNTSFIGGEHVSLFKDKFENVYNVKNCVPVANGTDAIFIALKMLGIGPGDEVITTAHSWISTSETISLTGAKPVFVDTDDYFTIDVNLIEKNISSRTKAIIPVHLYGQMADMPFINTIAKKYNLFVIEDCAQGHLSSINGELSGTFGDASTYSFYPGKNLGAYGDAGAIITKSTDLAMRCKMFANHGGLKKHDHRIEGINSRMDGLQAAILNVKLNYIKQWTQKRIKVANWYNGLLLDVSEVQIPEVRPNAIHSYHLYVLKVKNRDDLKDYLDSNNIDTAIHYPVALPFLPAYSHLKNLSEQFPNVVEYSSEILSLPIYPELDYEQVKFIVQTIKKFYSAKR